MKAAQTDDGRMIPVGGASRSGKTTWTMLQNGKSERAMVWDVEDQWAKLPGFKRITTRADLWAYAQKPGKYRVAFVPGANLKEEFQFFCKCAMYAARFVEALNIPVEELADVTSTGKAPDDWGLLLRRVLKRGAYVYPISQRWAEADKTALNNASEIVMFSCSKMDAEYMAKRTGVPVHELLALETPEENPDKPLLRFTRTGRIIARETLYTRSGRIKARAAPAAA